MKRILSSIYILCLCLVAMAQTNFRHITCSEAKAAAKAENKLVFIDFYTEWCGPCKMMAPIVKKMAADRAGEIDFYKVDIDKEQELAELLGIRSIPTFLFIPLEGKPTVQVGAMQKEDFEHIIESMLKK